MNKNIKLKIAFIMALSSILAAFVLLVLLLGIHNIIVASIVAIIYIVLLIRYLFKKADYLNEILKATEEMSYGNLDYVIKENGESALGKIAHNINNMKDGYKNL
ncbi:hypothetical protein JTS93_10375 [Clostridium botulinum]|nr:hypothetical protein [Clostridium botulinum]